MLILLQERATIRKDTKRLRLSECNKSTQKIWMTKCCIYKPCSLSDILGVMILVHSQFFHDPIIQRLIYNTIKSQQCNWTHKCVPISRINVETGRNWYTHITPSKCHTFQRTGNSTTVHLLSTYCSSHDCPYVILRQAVQSPEGRLTKQNKNWTTNL